MQPGGPEVMYKAVHVRLTLHMTGSSYAWDIRNADSKVERVVLLQEVAALVPDMVPRVRPLLATTPPLVRQTDSGEHEEMMVDRGLKQGEPLSNLLFLLALCRPLRAAWAAAGRSTTPRA